MASERPMVVDLTRDEEMPTAEEEGSFFKRSCGCSKPPGNSFVIHLSVVLVVLICVMVPRWVTIIDLYGQRPCHTERSEPMCLCTHFNDSWSCPAKNRQLPDSYASGFIFGSHVTNGTEQRNEGERFKMYFAFSIPEEGIPAVLALVLLILRIREVRLTISQSKREEAIDNITRSKTRTDELILQWQIAGGFFIVTVIHRLIVLYVLQHCETIATQGGLRRAGIVLELLFMFVAVVSLAVEVYIGKEETSFSMPRKMRLLSEFLGLCSLSVLINTLVTSTCMNDPNNEEVMSRDAWAFSKPLFYAASVGMYAQFSTLYIHIAVQQPDSEGHAAAYVPTPEEGGSPGQINRESTRPISRPLGVRQQENCLKALGPVLSGVGYFVPVLITAFLTIFICMGKEERFSPVLYIQLILHIGIIVSTFSLLTRTWKIRKRSQIRQREQQTRGCVHFIHWFRKWIAGDPERLVFIFYFLVGGLGYNLYNFGMYTQYGQRLEDKATKGIGQVEALFGCISSCLMFLIILFPKLLEAPVHQQSSGRRYQNWKTFWLKSLLPLTVSLAIADVLKEDFDPDETAFVDYKSSLFIFYDILRPIVVGFRIHTAIMMLFIVQDDRLKRKQINCCQFKNRYSEFRDDMGYGSCFSLPSQRDD